MLAYRGSACCPVLPQRPDSRKQGGTQGWAAGLNSLSLPLHCLDTTGAFQQHHGLPLASLCVLHATTRNLVENVSHVGHSPARLSVTPTGVCRKSAALPSTLVWVFGPHKPLSGSFRPQDIGMSFLLLTLLPHHLGLMAMAGGGGGGTWFYTLMVCWSQFTSKLSFTFRQRGPCS